MTDDLHAAVAHNKQIRRTASQATARAIRAGLAVIEVPLPHREPVRRDTYLAVNGSAFRLLGAGNYRLRQELDRVVVVRIDPRYLSAQH